MREGRWTRAGNHVLHRGYRVHNRRTNTLPLCPGEDLKDAVLCRARQCGTMVDVSQVMIAHTITCQIHDSRHTTHHFSRQKCFRFSDFRIWLLNGQNEIMLVEDLENFPFWIVFWSYKSYSDVGRNTDNSQTLRVPLWSRPHGHDRNLALCEVHPRPPANTVTGRGA